MREIKFRAWDRKKKEMIREVFEIGLGDRNNPETWLVGDDKQIDSFELMQYTGLKDKSGKPIFEGDLYRAYNGKEIYQVFFVNGAFTGGISERNSAPIGWDARKHDLIKDYIHEERFEIIGNRFENPELLTNKKE